MIGKQLPVGSCGFGARAEIHAERVQETWLNKIGAVDVDNQLAARTEISFDDYELIHDMHNHEKEVRIEKFTQPEAEFAFTGWGRVNERRYERIE